MPHVEHSLNQQEAKAARLRQSILKWAFEGKLVDQDPNDEPAAALLAHIRAERDQTAAACGEARTPRRAASNHRQPRGRG